MTYSGYTSAPQAYRSYYSGPQAIPPGSTVRLAPLPSDRAGDLNDESGGQPRSAPAPREQNRESRQIYPEDRTQSVAASRATIVVNVPEAAKVFIDGQPTVSTGETRTFVSPPLPNGEYHYTVRAELMQDGRRITTGKQVTVHAGQSSALTLDLSAFTPLPRQ